MTGEGSPVTITLTGLPSGITVTPVTLTGSGQGTLFLNALVTAAQEDFSPGGSPNAATVTITLLAFSSQARDAVSIPLTISLENPSFVPSKIDLPVVRINTGGVPILDKDTDVPGSITITSADGQTSYLPGPASTDNTATFHVHGNSTAGMPKKPYNVKLNTSLDLLHVMGLECGYKKGTDSVCDKSKSYILLANYIDKPMLRDWAAFGLANMIPTGDDYLAYSPNSPSPTGTDEEKWWAPHSLFVEVYVNDNYQGTYQLTEKITIDSHRVNINEMKDGDISGKALTGGYLLEIDGRRDAASSFVTQKGVAIDIDDPDSGVPEQDAYISDYISNEAEPTLDAFVADPSAVDNWRQYFDEASLVNFYIVNDVMGNVDGGAMSYSDYLYKDKNNPLIYMGPVWDFDTSSGNINYAALVNPSVPWMQNATWYGTLFQNPGFKSDVVKQWNALKNNGVFDQWLAAIDQQAAMMQQTQKNNYGRWPMLGVKVWPNTVAMGSYDGEVMYMTNWIRARIAYLDAQFNNKGVTETSLDMPTGTLRAGSAAILTARVSGGATPSGSVTLLNNGAVLGVGTLDGAGTATITVADLPAGSDALQALYHGDSSNAMSVSSPVTVNVLGPLLNSTMNIAPSSYSVSTGGDIQLTATVVANQGGSIPTGTVTFMANGHPLQTVSLSDTGTASYETTALPIGTNEITGTYSGDNAFALSRVNFVSVIVFPGQVPTPVFSVAGGTYAISQVVTLTDPMPEAVIYYTIDGTTPTSLSTVYTAPIAFYHSETIRAIAVVPGYAVSPVTSASYDITPNFVIDVSPVKGEGDVTSKYNIALTPRHRFSAPVTFSCVGLPADEACIFDPSVVVPEGGVASTTLTLVHSGSGKSQDAKGYSAIALGSILFLLPFGKRRWRTSLMMAASFLIVGGVALCGCGSGSSLVTPTTKTISFSVQATSGDILQTKKLTAVLPQ